jgi:hypothetical protein
MRLRKVRPCRFHPPHHDRKDARGDEPRERASSEVFSCVNAPPTRQGVGVPRMDAVHAQQESANGDGHRQAEQKKAAQSERQPIKPVIALRRPIVVQRRERHGGSIQQAQMRKRKCKLDANAELPSQRKLQRLIALAFGKVQSIVDWLKLFPRNVRAYLG